MEGRRAARQRDRVPTDLPCDRGLECVEVGADRCDPAAVERTEHGIAFGVADVGRRQEDTAHAMAVADVAHRVAKRWRERLGGQRAEVLNLLEREVWCLDVGDQRVERTPAGLVECHEVLVQLLTGPEPGEHDLEWRMVLVGESLCDVGDLDRFAHVEHEHLAVATDRPGVDHE